MGLATHWSLHQLTEYFSVVTSQEDEPTALRAAAENACESFDAEVGVVRSAGRTLAVVGLGLGAEPPQLDEVVDGLLDVAGLGPMHVASTRVQQAGSETLHVLRRDEPFTPEERQLLVAMTQALVLSLRSIRTVATERRMRSAQQHQLETRARLLDTVRSRGLLLERLLLVQKAVSRGAPIGDVVTEVATSAADLLDGAVLVSHGDGGALVETAAGGSEGGAVLPRLRAAVAQTVKDDRAAVLRDELGDLVAVPVHVGSQVRGAVAAVAAPEHPLARTEEVVRSFAQQVSTALGDLRTREELHRAHHDQLTGLPSRQLFLDRLCSLLDDPDAGQVALLFIDLDRFKQVNDCFGHAAGDELLVAVARRLDGCLREGDLRARLGGDEFAVVLAGTDEGRARETARRIAAALRAPFRVADERVRIDASVGIAMREPGGVDEDVLLGQADVAMYCCKSSTTRAPVVFAPSMLRDGARTAQLQ